MTTATLSALDHARRALCLALAERLQAGADHLAAGMTAARFREVPVYQSVAHDLEVQRAVHAHSRDHVSPVVHTITTWSLPTARQLQVVRGARRPCAPVSSFRSAE